MNNLIRATTVLAVLIAVFGCVVMAVEDSDAEGTTKFVSARGSDTDGDGSETSPYATLTKAVESIDSVGTVKFLTNFTMYDEDLVTIPAEKSITLDLNEMKGIPESDYSSNERYIVNYGTIVVTGNGTIDLNGETEYYGFVKNYGTLKVENGTFSGDKGSLASLFRNCNGGTATFVDGTYTEAATIINSEAGSTTYFQGGNYSNGLYPALDVNGYTEITGGIFASSSCTTCNNGEFGYCVRSGLNDSDAHLLIKQAEGREITISGVQGALAIIGGIADIYSGTFTTHQCDDKHDTAHYPCYIAGESYQTAATIYGGTFISYDKPALFIGNSNAPPDSGRGESSVVNVKGGEFSVTNPDQNVKPLSVQNAGNAEGAASVTGGTFNGMTQDDLNEYLPEGYEVGPNGLVEESADASFVAEIDGTKYTSLSEAVSNAFDGNTIRLVDDTTTEPLKIAKSIILDLGSHSITIRDTTSSGQAGGLYFVGVKGEIIGGTIIDERSKDDPTLDERYTIMTAKPEAELTIEGSMIQAYSPTTGYNDLIRIVNQSTVTLIDAILQEIGDQSTSSSNLSGVVICGNTYGTEDSVLNIKGNTTIDVSGYGITGNASGSNDNTTINIHNGTIESKRVTAILHTHVGTLNIFGGTIVGPTAVEMRAGELNISGDARLVATDPTLAEINMGSGLSLGGVAVGISQHSTNKDIDVTITGGTFIGVFAFYETDLMDEDSDNISASITGGTFIGSTGSVSSKNMTGFISGGTYLRGTEQSNVPDDSLDTAYTAGDLYIDSETGLIVEFVTVTFILSDGTENPISIQKGTIIPASKIPTAPEGYVYDWKVNDNEWGPSSPIGDSVTVTGTLRIVDITVTLTVEDGYLKATVECNVALDASKTEYRWAHLAYDGGEPSIETGSASYPLTSHGYYAVEATVYDSDGVSGKAEAALAYSAPETPETSFDIEHDGDSASVDVIGDTVIITSSGDHDDVDIALTFGDSANIEINGSVGSGAVTITAKPMTDERVEEALTDLIPESAVKEDIRGVDVTVSNVDDGYGMWIKVKMDGLTGDENGQFVASAISYYIDKDGNREQVDCYVQGTEVWIYTDHNTEYVVIPTAYSATEVKDELPAEEPDDDSGFPPFIPFPPEQGGDPVEVYPSQDGGSSDDGDDTMKVVAVAAAAVIAAILAIVLASTYRKN